MARGRGFDALRAYGWERVKAARPHGASGQTPLGMLFTHRYVPGTAQSYFEHFIGRSQIGKSRLRVAVAHRLRRRCWWRRTRQRRAGCAAGMMVCGFTGGAHADSGLAARLKAAGSHMLARSFAEINRP